MNDLNDRTDALKARRALGWFGSAVVSVLAVTFLVGLAAYGTRDCNPTYYLSSYQVEKLGRPGKIDTIFIGDSSLGNGIDAEHFDRISGRRSLNLALTGRYGYEGSYNMLKRVVRTHPEVRDVILVQAADTMQQLVSPEGFFYSLDWSHWEEDVGELSFKEKIVLGRTVLPYFASLRVYGTLWDQLWSAREQDRRSFIDRDYIRQGPPTIVRPDQAVPFEAKINPMKLVALERIVRYCRERKVNLVYAHGPVYSEVHAKSLPYFELVHSELSRRGVPLIPEVLLASAEEMGDNQQDHIAGRCKKEFTEKYYRVLRDRLSRD